MNGKTEVEKSCSVCNIKFKTFFHRKLCCSDICNAKRKTIACKQCNIIFSITRNRKKSPEFCNILCFYTYKKAETVKKQPTCPVCNKKFKCPPSSKAKTCSMNCSVKLRELNYIHPNCKNCGIKIVTKSRKRKKRKFCSQKCFYKTVGNIINKRRNLPNGSKSKSTSGYCTIKINGKWVYEHRYLMEQFLKRSLNKMKKFITRTEID